MIQKNVIQRELNEMIKIQSIVQLMFFATNLHLIINIGDNECPHKRLKCTIGQKLVRTSG